MPRPRKATADPEEAARREKERLRKNAANHARRMAAASVDAEAEPQGSAQAGLPQPEPLAQGSAGWIEPADAWRGGWIAALLWIRFLRESGQEGVLDWDAMGDWLRGRPALRGWAVATLGAHGMGQPLRDFLAEA